MSYRLTLCGVEASDEEEEVILLRGNSRNLSGLSASLFSVDPSESDTIEVPSMPDDELSQEESHSSAENSESEEEEFPSSFLGSTGTDRDVVKKRGRGLILASDSEDDGEEDGAEAVKFRAEESSPILKSVRSSMAPLWKEVEKDEAEEEEEVRPSMVRASTTIGGARSSLRAEWSFLAPVRAKNDDLKEVRVSARTVSVEKLKLAPKSVLEGEERREEIVKAPVVFKSSSSIVRRAQYTFESQEWSNASLKPNEMDVRTGKEEEMVIEIRHGNLTDEAVDAIVNAANSYLQHGGGVAGAISSKGGYGIQRESSEYVKRFGALDVGHCCFTRAYNIQQCKNVVHTVGPIYERRRSHKAQEAELYCAVFRSLLLADSAELLCTSIALPAISSGIFGFPKDDVARVIIAATMDFSSGIRPSIFSSNASSKTEHDDEENDKYDDPAEAIQILNALARPPRPPRSLRLIRLTNFDSPTVGFFSTRFDEIFGE